MKIETYIKGILWEFKNTTIKDKKQLKKYEDRCTQRILKKVVGGLDGRIAKLEEVAKKYEKITS